MEEKRTKIALVNQRYGLAVNGGSEYYTRQLAKQLSRQYEVEVLTTKALDYASWENYYKKDEEFIEGIKVRRFDVTKQRNITAMKVYQRLARWSPVAKTFFEHKWIDAQGPYAPGLIEYIKRNQDKYDSIIFVTYLYYPAVRGLEAVQGKAILLPTAHDEPYIYFRIFQKIFAQVKALIYLTPEEKEFVERVFPVADKISCIAGSGVQLPDRIDYQGFRETYQIKEDYIIYVGRIDESKGCREMFEGFSAYKAKYSDSNLKLVLMGKEMMEIPKRDDIISLGFVSEEDKYDGIFGARALWMPSQYESLSIVVLEALSLGVPIVVNGRCEVLKGHCIRSKSGSFYGNRSELLQRLNEIEHMTVTYEMRETAKAYVEENYSWDAIIGRMKEVISSSNQSVLE